MITIEQIRTAFARDKVYYSKHAKSEMMNEGFGIITDFEIEESIKSGLIIEEYLDDKPYPSVLILGFTLIHRPIHVVSAFDSLEELAIIITAYEPDPSLWIDFKFRRNL